MIQDILPRITLHDRKLEGMLCFFQEITEFVQRIARKIRLIHILRHWQDRDEPHPCFERQPSAEAIRSFCKCREQKERGGWIPHPKMSVFFPQYFLEMRNILL